MEGRRGSVARVTWLTICCEPPMSLRLWNPRHSACSFAGKLFPPFHYWTTVYRAYLRPCDRISPISSRASTRTGCELRVNYVSLFFSLIGEKKENILSSRNLSSKIHSFENSDGVVRKKGNRSERGRGDIVPLSRSPPQCHKSPQSAI